MKMIVTRYLSSHPKSVSAVDQESGRSVMLRWRPLMRSLMDQHGRAARRLWAQEGWARSMVLVPVAATGDLVIGWVLVEPDRVSAVKAAAERLGPRRMVDGTEGRLAEIAGLVKSAE